MEIVQQEGIRDIKRNIDFYNLDAIISVGYRVKHRVSLGKKTAKRWQRHGIDG
ncbi:MAG: virulence RhuM family protein [Paludibacteraceae bacterium]|nr:virulence RhuM family protein [Paludibacteraceae bacterium]